MLYNTARFNTYFKFLTETMPSAFMDNMHLAFARAERLELDDLDGVVALYESNFEPLTRLRVYQEDSIKKMIVNIYNILESYGLDHSYMGEEETFYMLAYPTGIEDFLVYKGYSEKSNDSTFQLFAAFLYVTDAFIRGEKVNKGSLVSAMEAFDFPRHFPELDQLTEAESFSRGISNTYDSIKKSADIPDYLLEDNSYILVDDVFYEKESVNKAIDGYSMTAQSLERQDLEGGLTGGAENLPEDERIIRFIKMLKENRKRKKNEVKSESNVDR